MSGLIGKLSFDPDETLVRAVLERMLDTCVDPSERERRIFTARGMALGWCGELDDRASAAAAIGTDERQNLRVVADSAIGNAAQLRTELEGRGHRFRGHTDCELIAHAWEEWGARALDRLRGPFACAIWDEAARRLTLARDHMGVRPLYYAVLPGHGVVFASQLRALLQDPGVSREWCADAIDAYLTLGYVPAPITVYRRVSKLEPASLLIVDGRRMHVEQYWDLPHPSVAANVDDHTATLDAALRTSLRRHLKDRRDTGVLYSGGTPSSVLLALAPAYAAPVLTIETDDDATEMTRGAMAARHLERDVRLDSLDEAPAASVRTVASQFEEPIADPWAVEQFGVCTSARRHMASALTAHGAAVLWGGGAHRGIVRRTDGFWNDRSRRALYTRGFAWQVRESIPLRRHLELYASRDAANPIDRALYVDARTFLPESVLATAERAARATGMRLRFPFLDRELVEIAAAAPGVAKMRGRAGMYALRRLLLARLPRHLMPPASRRPAGHGWLRATLSALVPSVLLSPRFDGRGIVSRPALAQIWDEHARGQHDHAHRLWSLLMLEFWFREFIDGAGAEEPLEYAVVKVA